VKTYLIVRRELVLESTLPDLGDVLAGAEVNELGERGATVVLKDVLNLDRRVKTDINEGLCEGTLGFDVDVALTLAHCSTGP